MDVYIDMVFVFRSFDDMDDEEFAQYLDHFKMLIGPYKDEIKAERKFVKEVLDEAERLRRGGN